MNRSADFAVSAWYLIVCHMKKSFFLAGLLLPATFLFVSWLLPDNETWRDKVDADVLLAAESGRNLEFLVVLQAQADVSAAKLLTTKEAKGEYVFRKLRETAQNTQAPLIRLVQQSGAPYQSFFIVNALLVKGNAALLQQLAQHSATARIEPNPRTRMQEPIIDDASESVQWRNAVEWGIERIGADRVWESGYTGQGVVIGGADTGYEWNHPAIRDTYRGWNGDTVDHNYHWHDAIHEIDTSNGATTNPCGLSTLEPCDDNNHGTHTMGTMTGGEDNMGSKIGVAPGARWVACRNMERGDGTPATYIECFEWFLAPTDLGGNNPLPALAPHVINNSWGCPDSEGCNESNWTTMQMVVANLKAAGIVVVVSAGNSGPSCSSVNTPAAMFEESFSIGATRNNDTIVSFSSRGPVLVDGSERMKPNVSAPGVGVRSSIRNGGYASFSGTSMAGPHVAGLVALLISANPELAGQVETIETIIEETALPMLSDQNCGDFSGLQIPNPVYGYGRVDAFAAVQRALELVSSTQTAAAPQQIEVFPNPFGAEINLRSHAKEQPLRLDMYNATGLLVFSRAWPQGLAFETISLHGLPSGIYLYRLHSAAGVQSGKLLKR